MHSPHMPNIIAVNWILQYVSTLQHDLILSPLLYSPLLVTLMLIGLVVRTLRQSTSYFYNVFRQQCCLMELSKAIDSFKM